MTRPKTNAADSKPSLSPKLRFPEFRSDPSWKTRTLGSFARISNEKVGEGECIPMSITSGIGLVSQVEKFGRVIAGDSYRNYLLLRRHDFAYNKSATKQYPEGFIAMYSGDAPAAVPNSIFVCFSINDDSVLPEFLNFLFLDNLHGKWLRKFIEVGARAHGSLSVSDKNLLDLPVPVPFGNSSRVEQRKVAQCLSALDELIEGESQKLDALKAHKKGLMQLLFPCEGETLPRLRFSQEDRWTVTGLPHVTFFQEGPGIMAVDFRDEGIPLVRLAGVGGSIVTLDGCNYLDPKKVAQKWEHFRLIADDLVISTSATFGLSSRVTSQAAGAVFYTGLIRFRSIDERLTRGYLEAFLGSFHFSRQAEMAAEGGGIKHFGPTHLKKMEIPIPPLVEQQRIASCLSSIDELIAAQREKLEQLKTCKMGMMQQLFPLPAEAEA